VIGVDIADNKCILRTYDNSTHERKIMYPSDFSEWLDAVDGDYNEMMELAFADENEDKNNF